ncbi:MAG: glycosyltransferase [Alphaproteobacteria bacterium]|nr:glycosyltransferase [Alphaproteobacteria bacterium]
MIVYILTIRAAMTEKIAVLISCYNEETTIVKVINEFCRFVPQAEIYVYDNNSTDGTAQAAAKAGALVRREPRQGKGNVVRRMFADIDADIYIMADGDGTYDISQVPEMIKELRDNNLDMIVGARKENHAGCYRPGHRLGNRLLTFLVNFFLKGNLQDILSGLRVFSRRFVKNFPATSRGFEIETEFSIFALSRRLPIKETETDYFPRPEGSVSKLSTWNDGVKILKTIINLVKEERPLLFFTIIATMLFSGGTALAVPIFVDYARTGLVPRFPTAILITGIMICAVVSFLIGLVLDSIAAARKEAAHQNYLHTTQRKTPDEIDF